MKIRTSDGRREAYPVHPKGGGRPTYRCFKKERKRDEAGRRLNTVEVEEPFETVEEAAKFLIDNPRSGIRMRPGSAIIYENIIVEMD